MREIRKIKVRAWHTRLNKMFSPEEMAADQLALLPDGSGFWNIHGSSTRLSQQISAMIPLQSFNMYDRNGKEIFDKDIVTADYHWIKPHIMEFPEDFYDFPEYTLSGGDLEVIGNIYENPELVENTK